MFHVARTMAIVFFNVLPASCTVPATRKCLEYQLNKWSSQVSYVSNWTLINSSLLSYILDSTPQICFLLPLPPPVYSIPMCSSESWHPVAVPFSSFIHPFSLSQVRSVLWTLHKHLIWNTVYINTIKYGIRQMSDLWVTLNKFSRSLYFSILKCV